jgi:O-antigen/teichoic acid export membrane protein
VIKRVLSVAGSRVLATLAQGFMLLILTQSLGPTGFGQFASMLVICGLTSALFGFGSGTLALRLQAHENPGETAGAIALLRYPTTLLAGGLTFLIGYFLLNVASPELLSASIALGVMESSGLVVESILFGLGRHRRAQASLLTRRLFVLAFVVAGAFIGDVIAWITISSAFLLLTSPMWLAGLLSRPGNFLVVVRESLPYWGAVLLSKLQTADILVASLVLSPMNAGLYAAASRITSPLNILASSMMSVFAPALSGVDGDRRLGLFKESMKFLGVVGGALIVLSPVIGWVIEKLLGTQYSGTLWPVAILCIGTGIAAMTQGLVSFMYAAGDPKPVFVVRLIAVPVALISAVPLGYAFGAAGVASAIGISQILQTVWLSVHVRRLTIRVGG